MSGPFASKELDSVHIDEKNNIILPLRVSNSHELTNFLYRKGLDKLPVIDVMFLPYFISSIDSVFVFLHR
jgi:hypothetical protein